MFGWFLDSSPSSRVGVKDASEDGDAAVPGWCCRRCPVRACLNERVGELADRRNYEYLFSLLFSLGPHFQVSGDSCGLWTARDNPPKEEPRGALRPIH